MITDADYLAWLVRGGRRIALVEVETDVPRFLSNVGYMTLPSDTPPNQRYLPCIARGFAFRERLSLDGNASISVGDIEIHNEDGALDDWLEDVWVNRKIRIYIGDADWPRDDFRLEFSGIIAAFNSSAAGRLNIVLRNKMERLNTPATETVLGGETPNKDRLLPVMLGENNNVEPLLIDPAQHEYMIHNGPMERLIEVRDNGVPLSAVTPYLATGKIRLLATPAGTITVSAQGKTPYTNTVAGIVKVLATEYGNPTERLGAEDLDAAALATFDAAHPQPVGISLSDRTNVMQACQQLAASVGAQVVMSQKGLLRLVKVQLPGVGPVTRIEPSDYVDKSLSIRQRPEVVAGVKLGYDKNWLVQTSLNTGIPPEHKSMFAQEWLTVTARDPAVADEYRLFAETPQVDTLLLRGADAQAEADRRLALWGVPRTVYGFTGYPQLFALELGSRVVLVAPRWDLDDGKEGIVIGIERDWIGGRCTVEVLT